MRSFFVLLSLTALAHAEPLISWKRLQLHGDFYSEGAAIGDINGDGKPDVVSGPFWWEGPTLEKKHAFYLPKVFSINGYSDNFFAYVQDFNGDKKNDILVLGFPGKEARLYLNPGTADDMPWEMHLVADTVDNESPVFTDITGDGKPEIVCSTGGKFGWFAPNWDKPTEKWTFVAATADQKVAKFTHGLGVGDVNGDGKMDLLEARHWWESSKAAEPNQPFTQHTFAAGIGGGAQMFAYDFDGDGRNDVVTALQAHGYGVAVYLNHAGNDGAQWDKVMLAGEQPFESDYGIVFSQPHAMHLADIDGDGIQDIVTGKRYWAHNGHDPDERNARVVYWYQTKRLPGGKVDFVPHLIDADSGVGVDVQVGDINGDRLPDIVVGNKAGVFVLLQERKEVSAELAKQMEPKKSYGPGLMSQKDYAHGQSPQEALKGMQLPPGFKADLIAAEPEIVQPIAMCWDARGRLWVVEGKSYPQPRTPGAGQDRILILEDKDGDGSFETKTVFAEGLSLVSGIEVGYGGVWVGGAPYFMFIADKNQDDKPDALDASVPASDRVPGLNFDAQILLDGWGSQDTHETLNSFTWGPDGWLYGCHGVFTHSKVGKPGTPDEQRIPLNAAVWRYHPVRHVFDIYTHGTSNPWGLDYDRNGEFFVTACVIPHLYHIVPGARYHRQGGQHFNPYTYEDIQTIADHGHFAGSIYDNAHWGARKDGGIVADDTNAAGGGHAHCGLVIYQSSLFPATYRNHLIFGNLHGHRLVMDYLDPHGSTFVGKHGSDFMRSNDMNFIPVTQKVGPDGALYVSDWSDKQVCHRGSNAVEMWDRSNGRIYRVSYAGWKPWKGDVSKEDDGALAKLAVQTENEWLARMARRILNERQVADPTGAAQVGVRKGFVDDAQNPSLTTSQRLRALWVAAAAGELDAGEVQKLIGDADPVLRTALVRILNASSPAVVQAASKEASPVVRRELASLLQRLPLEDRAGIAKPLLQRGEDKDDPYIPLMVWYGIEPAVGASPQLGLELARLSRLPQVTGFIYRRLGTEEAGRTTLLTLASETADAAQRDALINTVLQSARAGNKLALPSNWGALKTRLNDAQGLTELEAFMGVPEARQVFRSQFANEALARPQREAALKLLVQTRDAETAALARTYLEVFNPTGVAKELNADPLRKAVIQSLATLSDAETPALLTALLPVLPAAEKNDAINTLATNPAGARALLQSVKDKKIPSSMLSPFLARQMDTLKDAEVQSLLKEVWGDLNAPKPDIEQRKQKFRGMLNAATLAKADLTKGHLIFSAICGQCHKLFGEGQNVGPDLTGSNRGNLDYLLDNVLDPNAVIGKDYQLNIFELNDGRVASGVIKEETPTTYRVALPGGIEQIIQTAEVKKRTVAKVSTMPEGLFDALPQEPLTQLVAYLQSRTVDAGAGGKKKALKVEGAVEAEGLKGKATKGSVKVQGMGSFPNGSWSGDAHLWWTGGRPGDKLTITFSVPKAGKHKIFAAFTKAPDYGIVSVTLDGRLTAVTEHDFYDPLVIPSREEPLGEYDLTAGEHMLEVTITGTNANARPAYMFALDYLRFE